MSNRKKKMRRRDRKKLCNGESINDIIGRRQRREMEFDCLQHQQQQEENVAKKI